ncbi:similar to Saccharomyces cerevisiae YDR083W RRP8 Nucleolar protein involved in rRNA processing, pre-rRNA cleavage at site A2 [Maudiozyma barnettii]|uniref:Ribosomal RNA-processing protein 8 n=1 Tax=Maudiozyma barnettii TaxID=61262 RepID=A0A8H2VI28_9SACH|nr:25S rRNA (adenine645-N1)-methyltransferase [Kazachstania barnettii]CAB4255733.1 similar to Saccharomyces cerevisiae YDR083W RRP8 Nucleolar protein involved in rRNA processing, pre-rRNA cleavage at site A2 [Kazachstania barnettii]CAD1784294.1 similar to Saccharomyces cerevisiae YDR083W RRP8 Nucleolar protein involved in rRNA processing, pre-rRNA cleavage at site A2 [Kazachstania barnettii]
MELFKVEGWNLNTDKVAFKDSKKKEAQKERNRQEKLDRKQRNNKASKETKNEDSKQEEVEEEEEDTQDLEVSDVEDDGKKVNESKKPKAKPQKVIKPQTKPTSKQLTPLQQKMMAKLSGSRFRWINEQLYTISSEEALDLIKEQPGLFDEYHEGFRSQVQSWPENPVDTFVDEIKFRSKKVINAPGGLPGLYPNKEIVIADMGCGEAQLGLDVTQFFNKFNKRAKGRRKISFKINSFDLKQVNNRITVADIRHVPMKDESATIVIFCLALMGTNFLDFIKESYRILAPRGELWISEIKSRFADGRGDEFVETLKLLGFFHKKTDDSNKMFTRFEFFKPPEDIIQERRAKLERRNKFIEVETEKEQLEVKRKKVAEGKWLLKPCIYKRR